MMKLKKHLGIKTARELSIFVGKAGQKALTADVFTLWLIEDDKRVEKFVELVCEDKPDVSKLTYEELSALVNDFFAGSGGKLMISTAVSALLSDKEIVKDLIQREQMSG